MQVKKVLFINTETSPYVADSCMSVMGKEVPEAIQGSGCEIRTFMPKWGNINERRGQLHEVIRLSGMNIIIDETDHPLIIKVASIPVSRVQVYFIDNDDYFDRKGIATDDNGDFFEDNGERAVFFARGVLETVKKLRWIPDVIHCQGWMSSVLPFYIRNAYQDEPSFKNAKIVSTLFSSNQPDTFGKDFKKAVEFRDIKIDNLSDYNDEFDSFEIAKMVVDNSDAVILGQDNINQDVIEYIGTANKPYIQQPGGEFVDAYKALYEEICKD